MSTDEKAVTLTTDGGCIPNPGNGGWAYVLRYGSAVKEGFGTVPDTTNNRMEFVAAIEGLRALRRRCIVHLRCDSDLVVRFVKNQMRKPRKNKDLLIAFSAELAKHDVFATWVKGHNGDPDNERANELANAAATNRQSDK